MAILRSLGETSRAARGARSFEVKLFDRTAFHCDHTTMSSRLSIAGPVKQICSSCSTEIPRPRYPYPASKISIKDFEEVLSSSLNGCNFCRLCKDAIQQYFPGSEIGSVYIDATEYSRLTLTVRLKDVASAKLELCWEQRRFT